MKLKSLIVGAATALTMVSPAIADLTFPNLTYRTGPYAVNGIPYADGYADYMALMCITKLISLFNTLILWLWCKTKTVTTYLEYRGN